MRKILTKVLPIIGICLLIAIILLVIIKVKKDSKIMFVFENSQGTLSPNYVVENMLAVYDPKPVTKEYTATSTEYLFYVQEAILCYRYSFSDGSEIYINGITGEKVK